MGIIKFVFSQAEPAAFQLRVFLLENTGRVALGHLSMPIYTFLVVSLYVTNRRKWELKFIRKLLSPVIYPYIFIKNIVGTIIGVNFLEVHSNCFSMR